MSFSSIKKFAGKAKPYVLLCGATFFAGLLVAMFFLYPMYVQNYLLNTYGVGSVGELNGILNPQANVGLAFSLQENVLLASNGILVAAMGLLGARSLRSSGTNRKLVILLVVVAVCLGGLGGNQVSFAQAESATIIIDPSGLLPRDWSYLIYQVGSTNYAINGTYCTVDYSGSDSATVMNSAITATTIDGGKVLVKSGTYEIGGSGVGVVLKKNVDLIAENTGHVSPAAGTVLRQVAAVDVISYSVSTAGSEGNIRIEGFSLDGNNRAYTGRAISLINVSIAFLSRLRIYNFGDSAIYAYCLWSSYISDVIANNCGNATSGRATFYIGGLAYVGSANVQIDWLEASTNNYRSLDIYGADITISHFVSDAQPTPEAAIYGHIKILDGSRVIGMNDIFVRMSAFGTIAVENQADTSTWSGLIIESVLGTCFAISAYNSSAQLVNVYFKGVNSTHPAAVGFNVQAGFVQVCNYNYVWVTDKDSVGATGSYAEINVFSGFPQ